VSFLDRSLPARDFTNMGVVGEGTVAIKRRLERNVIGHGFDEVIIEAGINDIRGRNAVEHITAQLQSMVRVAKQAGLKVVLTTLPPWHQEVGKIATINDRIRAQGRHWGADVVVDIHGPLADWRGHLRRELVGDRMGLHPNREGQELIGRTILEAAYS
jgi:lysophospholipase L1-like esterase